MVAVHVVAKVFTLSYAQLPVLNGVDQIYECIICMSIRVIKTYPVCRSLINLGA